MTRQDAIEYDNWLKSGLMQEAEVLGLGEKAGSDLADRYITVIPDDERKGMVFLGEEAASYKQGNVRLDLKKQSLQLWSWQHRLVCRKASSIICNY